MANPDLRVEFANDNSNVIPMARYRRPMLSAPCEPAPLFEILCARAHEAKAYRDWRWAVRSRERREGKQVVICDETDTNAMFETAILVAKVPVATAREIRMKKSAIGRQWLSANGALYDKFRECVARDEAALAEAKAAKRGVATKKVSSVGVDTPLSV